VEKISCEFCEEKFFIPANLDLHVKRKHQSAPVNSENRPIKCLFCGKLFETKNSYRKHLKVSHKEKLIVRCKYANCFAIFRNEKCLEEHLQKVHFLNSVKCNICKIWISKSYLKRHLWKKHRVEQVKIKCEFCPESFDSKCNLYLHTRASHKTVAIECRLYQCQIYFKSNEEMENHFVNSHEINCKFCRSIFTNNKVYYKHLKKMHLEKKCKFSLCAFYTKSKVELEKHVSEKHCSKSGKHSECVYCGKYFAENHKNIVAHIRRNHSEIAIWCDKRGCGIFFKTQDDLDKHKKEAHKKVEKIKKSVECLYCQKTMCDKQSYVSHIKYHHSKEAIRCKNKRCFTFFKSEEDRQKHNEEKHAENFCCALCDYNASSKFSIKIHVQQHHLPRDIKCPHCPKLFGYVKALKNHIESNHEPKKNCPHCKKIQTNLHRHVVTANCSACFQPFRCKKLFSDHKLKCKIIHKCGDCGKIFNRGAKLKYHINLRHKFCQESSANFAQLSS